MIGEQFLFCEKYRPKTINDCILPELLKKTFQSFVGQKNIPNLLLYGTSGVGKTTVARALCEELGCDMLFINGSKDRGIDTVRNEISQFASSVSFNDGRKIIILDEADYLNDQSTQPALRGFIENFSKNSGFILTANYKNRIIPALISRCSVIDFKIPKIERAKLATQFFKKVQEILEIENIKYEPKVVVAFIEMYFPDWRRILNEIQSYSSRGIIDSGILVNLSDISLKYLVSYLKVKDFSSIRKWVVDNDADSSLIFRKIYDISNEYMQTPSIPELILILADYQFKASFVVDHQLNLTACLLEIMMRCTFK